MSYEKMNVPCINEGERSPYGAEPGAPLSAIMDVANNLSGECLHMARAINHHMFGIGQPDGEVTGKPLCFRDALSLEVGTLQKLREELSQIMKEIGM